ncbi:MAG: RNA 2',3'-cyclic phosphodiesterase [Roseivivax sp.]|nr:RNA 2',3'-cyclic phosphodiesterase [Roseivivax sp.]
MRAFVGIPVTEAAAGPMLRLQDALRLPRPVPEENLHLTLAFLDECDLPTLEQVNEGLEAIVAPAMTLRVAHLDLIGSTQAPGLIAAMIAPDPALTALRNRVRRVAEDAGVPLARERFRPHVTLIRIPRAEQVHLAARARAAVGATLLHGLELSADRFALYRSTIGTHGSVYDVLAEYPLRPVVPPPPAV